MPMSAEVSWTPLVLTLVLFVALYWVSRRLAQSFMTTSYLLTGNENIASALYIVFVWPGTLLHETSHWLMAKLLGVKTGNISVMPKFSRKGPVRLGSVEVKGGNLLQMILIGVAPFFVGSFLTVWVSRGLVDLALIQALWDDFSFTQVGVIIQALREKPDNLLGLYFLFTASDAMFLSGSDVVPIKQVLVYVLLGVGVLLALGVFPKDILSLISPAITILSYLVSGLSLALGVHVLLWALLAVIQVPLRLFR